ncbi:signal recognition particle-docking protein FtsY [Glaesserella sp.]|uniref:signal recognition particle-docking protein FtsY n=1 Tax=Glaesserella sp. TaxID=2094731 RepID=UPI0035A17C79
MTDEKKKKGFWSWLGFGKKEQQETPSALQQEAEQTADETNQQAVGSEQQIAKPTLESEAKGAIQEVIDKVEQNIDDVKAYAEQAQDRLEETVDRIDEWVEQIEDRIEEKLDVAEDFVEEKVAELKAVAEAKWEAIEDTVEEKVERLEEMFDKEDSDDDDKSSDLSAVSEEPLVQTEKDEPIVEEITEQAAYQEKPSEGGFFSRLIKGLIKTKQSIGSGFRNFFRGKKIDDDLFEELEEQLLMADLGMPTTTKIINNLTQHATKQQLRDAELLYQQLKLELAEVLKPVAQPLVLEEKKPYVILMVGVNGVGKTTTIGKLARKFQAEGKSVMLAAGDTFRAAAVEQLQVWGERNHIPVVAQSSGSDSASVIFDAMQSAAAKGIDVLIADTAGRLQNKNNLMDELKKIVRVMKKYDESAPHEIMLTLDAGTGQNAISQAKLFNEAVGLTGITLTKLDGTAKGGVIFAIADQFNIPIRYIGVGEKIDDLRPFNADEFIEALFAHEEEKS